MENRTGFYDDFSEYNALDITPAALIFELEYYSV